MSITIIPDIHADPVRLQNSLDRASGSEIWFLGDLIDGGKVCPNPDDESVLKTVKKLVDTGKARCILGNHELNAILYHRQDDAGHPLRKHEPKNITQHRTFIEAFGVGTPKALYWTDWFLELPLWIDTGDLRIIHACWDDRPVDIIKERYPNGFIDKGDLEEIAAKESALAEAIDLIVSGPELRLPEGYQFSDTGKTPRDEVRISWWKEGPYHWREHALSVPNIEELPDELIETDGQISLYPDDAPPVAVGHYKLTGDHRVESKNAICLDYPEQPCVYHWDGETSVKQDKLKPALGSNI